MDIERKEFWSQHLEKFKVSGLPRTQYCNKNDINYDMFGYWIKRLSTSSASSSFIPVKLKNPEPKPTPATLCTIDFRGYNLKIHDLTALKFILDGLA